MDFELQWLLWGLPLAFALGWIGSRWDVRQWRRELQASPKVYYKGLNLLLSEQHDKAIDAFIEAVQQDPDTSELHFALGNLFRRRGEYERAVRVHQHLLGRADLAASERDRAQHALAQDYMKAGLLDRAEQAYKALAGTAFDTEARLALLDLHERSRDWRAAVDVALQLEKSGTGSFASRIAHYWCEIALEAEAAHDAAAADQAVARALEAGPRDARPLILAGERAAARGDHAEALRLWTTLMTVRPTAFNLVARRYAASARALDRVPAALERLQALYDRTATLDLLETIASLQSDGGSRDAKLLAHLREHPTIAAAAAVVATKAVGGDETAAALSNALRRAARPLHRYRCAACGFEAEHYFWQCPGCLGWDTYPPQRLEDL
ncbi:MAG TPA: lipopolysaccharide assembly protein LapB [Caldimonas sp.]|jgi:lipopolysaccharide biosynthesis regulator YciM|nr:lipopolysaccharide assembly protein LapB [Caldimonas sp.]HEX2543210.1 lipopolysaccharide assembly protein LapB [Caldimonas sp.]